MRFNLVAHDPDALFNIIDQQRRDQAVIEATDAARRQKGTRREARSVAAAGTKLQGNAADKPDGSQSAKTAGVKAERNRRYENNECFVCGKQGHKQWDCPQNQQGKAGKGVHGQSHDQDPKQQQHHQQLQQSPGNPAQYTQSKGTGIAPASATPTRLELVGTRPPEKRWLREANLLRLRRLRRRMTITCTFACRGRMCRQWIPGAPRRCSTTFLRALGRKM